MPSLNELILIALVVWTSAVCWKATRAVRASRPYTFSWWDGGALLGGKHLTNVGAKVQLVCSGVMAAGGVLMLLGVMSLRVGGYALMPVAAVIIVADFACVSGESKGSKSKARGR